MKLSIQRSFARDYSRLPQEIQERVDKQIETLLADPAYPSLNFKKMHGVVDIWECRVTQGYRFTFQIKDDCYILRRVGTHDVLRRP